MKRLLALDMSSRCGWAFQSEDGAITSGVTPFLGTFNPGDRWVRFDAWLGTWGADLFIYEEPITVIKHKTSLGFGYAFEALLHRHAAVFAAKCIGVNVSTLKKYSTGMGNATKHQMICFARQINPEVNDDNEADAILLLEYARKRILNQKENAA